MKVLTPLFAAGWATLLIALLTGARVYGATPAPRLEAAIRDETLARAGKSASRLTRDEVLANVARGHSRNMYRQRSLGHDLSSGIGPAERLARDHRSVFGLVSENVAVQHHWPTDADLAKRFVQGWMNSPGHRANILADYDTFETGCYGDAQTLYCTQLFLRATTRLAHNVPFLRPTGTRLNLALAKPDADISQRISIRPADAAVEDPGTALNDGAAALSLPDQSGLYQLELWTRRSPGASRYRILPGPWVCTTSAADDQTPEACTPAAEPSVGLSVGGS